MRLTTIGVLAMLASCGGDKGEVTSTGDTGTTVTDTDTDTSDTDTDTSDTDTTPNCANAVLGRYPSDGASDVYVRSGIDVQLSQADPAATIVVTDSAGTPVPGEVSLHDGDRRVQFLPGEDYLPGEEYTASLEWGCDPRDIRFTAGSDGADPVADPASLIDKGYSLDLKDGRFVAPDGIGAALESMLEVKLLLGVTAADATSVSLRAGAEDGKGGQDLSATTTDFSDPAAFANPFFSVTQDVLPLVIEGDPIDVQDLSVSGSFAADGSEIVGFRMSGIVDTRDLKDAVGVSGDGDVCALFGASFNVQCEACPGGGDYCITLVVADLPLPETNFTVEVVP